MRAGEGAVRGENFCQPPSLRLGSGTVSEVELCPWLWGGSAPGDVRGWKVLPPPCGVPRVVDAGAGEVRGVNGRQLVLGDAARGAAADSLARGREAGTRRNDRQPAVDHVPALESRHANRALIARDASCPEAFCRDPADRAADVRVGGYPSHVRANHPVAALESSIRLVRDVIDVRDVGDIRHVHHRKAVPASPPREEGINGTKRAPAERTEAPAEPPAEMMEAPAETEERNVSRTPGRVVVRRHITRPPVPLVVPIYPAAVVIGRPAPRLVRDPCPAVIGVPNPPTVSVWGPVVALIGLPYVT